MTATPASGNEDLVAQTVVALRRAAARSGALTNSFEVVNVLKGLLNALK